MDARAVWSLQERTSGSCTNRFGEFTRLSLPASFNDTANAIERLSFAAKDTLLVVDDYHPARDQREAQAMGYVASRLLRSVGNNRGRSRMRADTSLRPELWPRCVPVVSGERLPEGHSSLARIFPVPVEPGTVDLERLSKAQTKRPLYAQAMSAYIQYLAGKLDDLRDQLPLRFQDLRRRAQFAGGHRREPGQVAYLQLSLDIWLEFAVEIGAVSSDERTALVSDSWDVLLQHARQQANDLANESPVQIFLALLADGFASKRAYFEARSGGLPENAEAWGWARNSTTSMQLENRDELRRPSGAMLLGMLDDDWLLLFPEAAYRLVKPPLINIPAACFP